MNSLERRKEMIEYLCQVRHTTYEKLCYHFAVSLKTVKRDILELTLSYPIITKQGKYGGGIYIADGYYLGRQYLTDEQEKLLKELTGTVNENQAKILQQILSKFGNPIKQGWKNDRRTSNEGFKGH